MSKKNFASAGDMETLVTEIASKYEKKANIHSIPSGGTTGQVLAKNSGTDYDAEWITLKNSRVVELSETNIQTEVGTAKTVTVKYRVAGNSDTATYTSSDTSVATVAVTGHSSTVTSATDVITITPVANGDCTIKIAFTNKVGYDAEYDYINVTVGTASGGSSIKKIRYTITASSWSASANSDGYYTYTVALNPAIKSSPTVYLAGTTASTGATDTEKSMYALLNRCRLSGSSSITLYTKTKPSSNFYIFVEGEEGTTSDNIEGTIVPAEKGGSGTIYSTTETLTGDTWIDGRPIYRLVVDRTIVSSDYNDQYPGTLWFVRIGNEYRSKDINFVKAYGYYYASDTYIITLNKSISYNAALYSKWISFVDTDKALLDKRVVMVIEYTKL